MDKFIEAGKSLANLFLNKRAPKGLFLHIQKTAGTSIIHIAQSYYRFGMISHGDHVGKPPKAFRNLKFVSGHFGYDFAQQLMGDRYSFTFLRNPESRILSMYYFLRGQKENLFPMYKLAKELSLTEFLRAGLTDPMVKQRIWNNQVWQLAHGWANRDGKKVEDFEPNQLLDLALTHIECFNHVGITETFEKDRDIILNALHLPLPEEKVVSNVSSRDSKPLSEEQAMLLKELTVLDWQLYKVVCDRHGRG
ncbi:Sulfotransferase family protein [Mariprofundus ferrinatatus]|uniref:Sulfotransferase family protein n=1 Tax=Mariprofundus ferrinatatus TaxID=1921087 RepID=A0A2K8L2E2_9PROT|nr:sulfotransferase family 2 domain-containing protein [Mariprofundus ferrinatatus]ATX81423.1 Sulfotransferase family protein [Mariprofundus ferrinatatus]